MLEVLKCFLRIDGIKNFFVRMTKQKHPKINHCAKSQNVKLQTLPTKSTTEDFDSLISFMDVFMF